MAKITDYGFLFQNLFGTTKTNPIGSFRLSNLNSRSVQQQLKAAGIDINSKQYKTVIKNMMSAANGNGAMYTNPQAIKNLMKNYDEDGDYISPVTGLAGLLVTEENDAARKRIISIPESSREEMFQLTKREFIQENGVANGDTTKRSDVYTNLYRKMNKNDRLAAGYTMEQYERAYSRALYAAVRKADPNWRIGNPIPKNALDGVTRESVEASLVQSGNKLVSVGSGSDTAANGSASYRKTIAQIENAFAEQLKNSPQIIKKEEMSVEVNENVRAEKMARLEKRLKEGSAASEEEKLDMKI